jgi:hypothetical protein
MEYLLEEYLFSDDDIRLNADTLLWPRNIGPIFDTNDEVEFFCFLCRREERGLVCFSLLNKFEGKMNKFLWKDVNVY